MYHLVVLTQSLKIVYSHLTNKKKELKRFLEYINANNSNKFRILVKNQMINRSSSSSSSSSSSNRLATRRRLRKIIDICISMNKRRIKIINFVLFIELNSLDLRKSFFLVHFLCHNISQMGFTISIVLI